MSFISEYLGQIPFTSTPETQVHDAHWMPFNSSLFVTSFPPKNKNKKLFYNIHLCNFKECLIFLNSPEIKSNWDRINNRDTKTVLIWYLPLWPTASVARLLKTTEPKITVLVLYSFYYFLISARGCVNF